LEIDNLLVEIDGPELPILDGSSEPFVALLQHAGTRRLSAPRRVIEILEPITVTSGAKSARLEPSETPEFDVVIRYGSGPIGVQRRVFHPGRDAFLNDIAGARTYGFLHDVERLHAAGLGRGASLDNTVVIDGERIVNEEGLRFDDEFVRHKILDAVGDLALLGAPFLGRYVGDQPGHELNVALARALLASPTAWRWAEAERATLAAVG
jgi:UDP-3-O-[3-hydroxymyristoyl] N-acetylglucosamine deacetylase